MSAPILTRRDEHAVLDCGPFMSVDLVTGAVEIERRDALFYGAHETLVRRTYSSAAANVASPLGAGWAMALPGCDAPLAVTPQAWLFRAHGAEVELRSRGEGLATLEVRRAGVRYAVRWLDVAGGKLLRVRDEHERLLEEYEYDGALLVGARSAGSPWRYFEYDGRGHRSRCVRSWSATGARDRQISYTARATVVDDACGKTWIVRREATAPVVVDPEMREHGTVRHPQHADTIGVDLAGAGEIVRLRRAPGGAPFDARVDATGAIVELARGGDRVRWMRGTGGAEIVWLRDGASHALLALDARGAPVRLVRATAVGEESASASYDDDGAVVGWKAPSGEVAIENDPEGRAIAVRGPRGSARIHRDRAGRVVRVEGARGDSGWAEWAAHHALAWHAGTLRRLLDGEHPRDLASAPWHDVRLGPATTEHVRACALEMNGLISEEGA